MCNTSTQKIVGQTLLRSPGKTSYKIAGLGDRLRQARLRKGLSQSGAAALCGVSQQNISRYEEGAVEPTAGALLALAKLYEVSTDWLLTGQEP